MTAPINYDALVLGGGPAGSTCARILVQSGLRVAVLDRQRFPRLKLCGGWLSPAVWDVLELSPRAYPAGIWEWNRCHVQHGGTRYTLPGNGHFIRRYELDHFLLERSGAEFVQHSARQFERRDGSWIVDERYAAPWLIGAGGTHCPVARQLFPKKPIGPVGAQEHEFVAGADAVAATRVGRDGEPELLLHDDLAGYSWNVPKGEWLNVGTGTAEPREVRAAWASAREFFAQAGHIPADAAPQLDDAAGHSYYLFHPEHLLHCEADGACLVGDALGLAHPLTAEGILPSLISARLAAEAIVSGVPGSYQAKLESHPVMRDYALTYELYELALALRDRFAKAGPSRIRLPARAVNASRAATARGFAWMFSGRPLPYAGTLRSLLRTISTVSAS